MANVKISNFALVTNGAGSKPDVRNLSAIAGVEGAANAKISGTELVSSVINSNNSGAAVVVPHRVTFYGPTGEDLGGSENFSWDNTTATLSVNNLSGGPVVGRLNLTHEKIEQLNDSGLTIESDASITIQNAPGILNSFHIPNANTQNDGFQMWYDSGNSKHYITGSAGTDGYIRFSQQNGELEMGDGNLVSLASSSGSDLELKVGSNSDDLRVYLGTTGPSIGDVLAVGGLDGNTGLMEWTTPSSGVGTLQQVLNAGNTAEEDPAAPSPLTGKINLVDTGGKDVTFEPNGITNNSTNALEIDGVNGILTLTSDQKVNIVAPTGGLAVNDTGQNVVLSANSTEDLQLNINGTGDLQVYLGTAEPAPAVGDVLAAKNTSGGLEWITPSSGGGGGITTLTAGATTSWDYTNGENAIWTPTVTTPNANQLSMTNVPAGARGALKIIPTNTTDFLLPANSKAASGDITISGVNPSILYYFYDGSTFYWFAKTNMIDPIYLPNVSKANLLALYAPSSYEGSEGNVDNGSAWPNSYTQNNLLGDLTAVNTDTTANFDIRFTARDDASNTPAHFFLGEDGANNQGWFNIASALGGNVNIGSWTGAMWFQTVTGTNTSYNGLMDPDKDDDDAIYVYQRRIYIEGPGIYTNFPALVDAGEAGNDNAFDLQDEWIYLSCAFNYDAASPTDSTIDFVIGCQATLDNAGGTIVGFDGTNISIGSDGTYKESVTVTLAADTWNDFAYGASVTTGGTVYEFEGKIALAAVYSTNLSNTLAVQNWNATKEFYYIT